MSVGRLKLRRRGWRGGGARRTVLRHMHAYFDMPFLLQASFGMPILILGIAAPCLLKNPSSLTVCRTASPPPIPASRDEPMSAGAQDHAACHDKLTHMELTHMGLQRPVITLGGQLSLRKPRQSPRLVRAVRRLVGADGREWRPVSYPNKHPSPELRPVPHGTLQPAFPAEIADSRRRRTPTRIRGPSYPMVAVMPRAVVSPV